MADKNVKKYLQDICESIVARNFNVPFVYGNIDLRNFKSHRKNPHIANVFSQTIMVEELGSGTKRIRYA